MKIQQTFNELMLDATEEQITVMLAAFRKWAIEEIRLHFPGNERGRYARRIKKMTTMSDGELLGDVLSIFQRGHFKQRIMEQIADDVQAVWPAFHQRLYHWNQNGK